MTYFTSGYAQRAMSTMGRNDFQERPEEESWHSEFNVPFSPKRPASQVFENQAFPLKRPRHSPEVPHQYGLQNQINADMNGNINARHSLRLPPLENFPRQHAQHGPVQPQLSMMESMPYQTGLRPNSMESHSRLPESQIQANHAISNHTPTERSNMPPIRSSPYTESALRQPEVRKSLAKPFSPGQNVSRQPIQSQNPRGARDSSLAPSQGQDHKGMAFATNRYQSVPPQFAAHHGPSQHAISGAGSFGHGYGSQPSPQRFQPSRQELQYASQKFLPLHQGFQNSPQEFHATPQERHPSSTQTRPNTMLQTDLQLRGQTDFVSEVNIPKRPAVKQTGPFILDDDNDEDEIVFPASLTANTQSRSNAVTGSQTSIPFINFAQGRRGVRPLTHGLDDPPDKTVVTGSKTGNSQPGNSQTGKSKPKSKYSKKAGNAVDDKIAEQAEAYAKIKEKQDMAAKANSTDALFDEPVNEAAQARINASKQKEETRRREIEVRKKHKQAMAEDLERLKKEAAESAKVQKENERTERASSKAKTQEEREEIQKAREADDRKRHEEQRRRADALLLINREEQNEREALAREKEAATEAKRQQDAENLKKALEASKLAATSLKAAKKGQIGRGENARKAPTAAVEEIEPPVDDGGLFVSDQVADEPLDKATPADRSAVSQPAGDTQRLPLTPTSPLKGNPAPNTETLTTSTEQRVSRIAATIKEIPGSDDVALRAIGGWRGARKANTETKVASVVIEHFKEKLLADQKMREDAAAQELARERLESQEAFAALFEKLSSNLTGQVRDELKAAVDKVLNVRLPIMTMDARAGPNRAKSNTVSPRKYASETQCLLGRNTTKQPKELMASGEKSLSASDARKREKEETRLAEKARRRFENKLHRDNAEQSRPMTEYEFRSHIDRQKEYRAKRDKKFEKERRMKPYGGGSPQAQVRFGYEDIDFNNASSSQPNNPNAPSDKGRCGGVMARLRDSNGSLGYFQEAAGAKSVDRGVHRLADDTDSESDISEEDPDDDEPDNAEIDQPELSGSFYSSDSGFETTATKTDETVAITERFVSDSRSTHLIKPRHLQDKEMVYIFSVQRSEIRNREQSLPITIKQFFDRDDANEFAEEELRRTRWGPSMAKLQITQLYLEESGLFRGRATMNSKDNMVECVDVVAQAQYIGDLDDVEHDKIKAIIKPKLYLIFKSIARRVQTPIKSSDEASDNSEEAESDMEAEPNMEAEQVAEAEQTAEAGRSDDTEPSDTDMIGNNSESSDGRKNESLGELAADAIDALFEDIELSDNSDHDLAVDDHQLPVDFTAPSEITLTETVTALEIYTDRELANKRASEIFLAEIRPVGGDISQLVKFLNEAEKPVRESLDVYNKSGELFFGSNDGNNGEELRVWVEDFQTKGPLN